MKIFKYIIQITDLQSVALPPCAQILSVQAQAGALCLWALVTPSKNTVERLLEIFGTGNPIPDADAEREFIGTVQLDGFVWHIFERR